MDEIAAFLRVHPPFDAVAPDELERLAGAAETCAFAPGEIIFAQGAAPQTSVWIVCSGGVELVDHGRVLDLLGPGELFGFSSMLAELPTGFAARAHGETACYRLPGDATRPLLARPESLRHVTRTILGRPAPGVARAEGAGPPAERPVGALLRAAPVRCEPSMPIRTVAERMTEAGQTCAVVELRDGALGILTDRDLRTRVVVAGLSPDAPVSEAMSAPAHTVTEDRLGGDVLVEMLDRGVRHFPVLSGTGALLGVVDDVDLVAAERRTPFHLRTAIAPAPDARALAVVARRPLAHGGRPARGARRARPHRRDHLGRHGCADAPPDRPHGRRPGRAAGAVRLARARQPRAPRGRPELGRRLRGRVGGRRPRPGRARLRPAGGGAGARRPEGLRPRGRPEGRDRRPPRSSPARSTRGARPSTRGSPSRRRRRR